MNPQDPQNPQAPQESKETNQTSSETRPDPRDDWIPHSRRDGPMGAETKWRYGLCDCCDSCRNCWCAYCCVPCLTGENAERMHDDFWLWCILSCLCPCFGTFFQRRAARKKFGIRGNAPRDLCAAWCCNCCAAAQIANELDSRDGILP